MSAAEFDLAPYAVSSPYVLPGRRRDARQSSYLLMPPLTDPCKRAVLSTDSSFRSVKKHRQRRSLHIEDKKVGKRTPSSCVEGDEDSPNEDRTWARLKQLLADRRVAQEAIEVFNCWLSKDVSRADVANYSRFIHMLCREGLVREAASIFSDMEKLGQTPNSSVYNDIIHGPAKAKQLEQALGFLQKMAGAGLSPTSETFDRLIQAYGSLGMYDEMCKCFKSMTSKGCFPTEITYNILIRELAEGGLTDRMEASYRTLISKKMILQNSTMIKMTEAYADLGIVDKMEKCYRKAMKSNAFIKEDLIKKVCGAYIGKFMFSRLEEVGNDLSAKIGRTRLVWCILLLSCACSKSRKGIESVVRAMKDSKFEMEINFINILALFYLGIRDFRSLDNVFYRMSERRKKPDVVTFGVLFDACGIGYEGAYVLENWRKRGYLEETVNLLTDSLVLAAFGKGCFMRACERAYSSLDMDERKKKKMWTYGALIGLVYGAKRGQERKKQMATM